MEGKGRGAVAARELGPGTLIARERALAAVLYLPKVKDKVLKVFRYGIYF